VHSLHATFLRPGDPTLPLRYSVAIRRSGRSFTTCAVEATQADVLCFMAVVSFARPEEGLDYQAPIDMSVVPEPISLRTYGDWVAEQRLQAAS